MGSHQISAADKRVQELLDRWLASLDLHLKYLALDDGTYAKVEAWPKHQRPTRWVLDLARTRLLELQASLVRARAKGDSSLAEALELMSFLTSLLASEHIDRFIPLATGKAPKAASITGTVEQTRLKPAAEKESSAARRVLSRRTATKATASAAPTPKPPAAGSPSPPRTLGPVRVSAAQTPQPTVELTPAEQLLVKTVVADAVRFLEWGTEWPAVASKIAHLAGRPAEAQIRNILRANRDLIQSRSKRPVD